MQERGTNDYWYIQVLANVNRSSVNVFITTINAQLRWSRGSVLAFGTQVRGFTPG